MYFLNQANKGQGNLGTYVLTIIIAFLSLVVGQSFVELIANSYYGFSLIEVPGDEDNNVVLTLLLIPFTFALLSLFLCVRLLHKRPILSVITARDKFDWKRFFLAFFMWGGIMAIALAITMGSAYPIELNFDATTFFPLLLISLILIPIQTTAEEVLFRGYIFQAFGHYFKKGWIAIFVTGTLFGLLHWANPEVAQIGNTILIFYIGSGIFLGILAHLDDGLELTMGYHAINNIFASLIITNNWQAFQTDAILIDQSKPEFSWEIILTLLVLQPMLILFFARIYKWNNWRKKLLE